MLLLQDLSVAEVAIECGFTSPAAFSREFKRIFGLSPSDFRKNGKNLPTDVGDNTPTQGE